MTNQSAEDLKKSGDTKSAQGDYEGAIQEFNKALEIEPRFARVYNNRGLVKKTMGDTQGALNDFIKAIELDPQLAAAHFNLGQIKTDTGDFTGAIKDLSNAININENPLIQESYLLRGANKYESSDFSGAILDFDKVIESDQTNSIAYYLRGATKLAVGDEQNSLKDLKKAEELGNENASNLLKQYQTDTTEVEENNEREIYKINGKEYIDDENHICPVRIKKSDAKKYPQYDWMEDEEDPELVYDSFFEIIPWKDGKESRDYDTYQQDFCSYYDLDPKDIVDIGPGAG